MRGNYPQQTKNGSDLPCTTPLWQCYRNGKVPVIPDIKCKSPGEGDLLAGRDPVAIARSLAQAGAPVISVVTETEHYGGSLSLLSRIGEATGLPVLRKDFITTGQQLLESREHGASGVLLIAAILEKRQLEELVEQALELGLEPLVETHNPEEIKVCRRLNSPSFLGINNRNIIEWELDNGDVATTEQLARLVPEGVFLLSESGITGAVDVKRAIKAGAHGVLVGTGILKAGDPVEKYLQLVQPLGGEA